MTLQVQAGGRIRFGMRLSLSEHLIGLDVLFATDDDPDRIITVLVGVPFISFKMSVRRRALGIRGAI